MVHHAAMATRIKPLILLAGLLGATCFHGTNASAEDYPTRPITMLVPFAAGGPSDTIARLVADGMRASLGQPVIIENAVGAGGTIAVGRVVRAAPDGYTIGIGNWGTHVANGVLYVLPYDLVNDLQPVSLLPSEALLIAAKKTVPASDLALFIVWLKQNADKVSAATSGVGGPSHMATLLFQKQSGTQFQLVPYRGAGPAFQDLVAGQIDLMMAGLSLAVPKVRDGSIKVFAVTAPARVTSLPDIPTTDEAGLPGFHVAVWHGLWTTKSVPAEAVRKLTAAVQAALADATVRQRLAALAMENPPADRQTPEALAAYQKAEIAKWWPIMKDANVRAQ
jgi:tripartite-type tricarboxylate transporter receptor subunit TctC